MFMRVLIGLLRKGIIDLAAKKSGFVCIILDFSIIWRIESKIIHKTSTLAQLRFLLLWIPAQQRSFWPTYPYAVRDHS